MPNHFHKALRTYFSKSRRSTGKSPENAVTAKPANSFTTDSSSSHNFSANFRLCSACSFPRTPSFALARSGNPSTDIHLYDTTFSVDDSDQPPEFTSFSGSPSSGFSTDSVDISLDLASAVASERFFVPPRLSNSIVDDAAAETAAAWASDGEDPPVRDRIAVATFSLDPFIDFRRSMQEMVDARLKERQIDCEYLEELLSCFLKLNDPCDHGFILEAFTDLLAGLEACDSEPDRWISGAMSLSEKRRKER